MSENKFHKSRIFFKTALCDVIVIIIIYDTKNNTTQKKKSQLIYLVMTHNSIEHLPIFLDF